MPCRILLCSPRSKARFLAETSHLVRRRCAKVGLITRVHLALVFCRVTGCTVTLMSEEITAPSPNTSLTESDQELEHDTAAYVLFILLLIPCTYTLAQRSNSTDRTPHAPHPGANRGVAQKISSPKICHRSNAIASTGRCQNSDSNRGQAKR